MFPFGKVVLVCWVVFWLYWIISAFRSKKNVTSNYGRFMGIRFVLILLAIVLFHSLNGRNYSFQNRIATSSEAVLIIGFVVFLLGLLLAIWARVHLGRNWGMPMSKKQNPELVTSGPYRYIRHPIYTGFLLAIIGSALASSLFWLIIFLISGIYFIYSAVQEEKIMTKEFPKIYPLYKSKTKMLIPFIF